MTTLDDFRYGSRHLVVSAVQAPGDREYYLEGSCHAFAVGLHRKYGLSLYVVCDPDEIFWHDDQDAGASIPSVLHVYAVDHAGMAWDVLGSRPCDAVHDEMKDRHGRLERTESYLLHDEASLDEYVDCDGDVERPLHRLSEEIINEAFADIERILAPHLPPPPAVCAP